MKAPKISVPDLLKKLSFLKNNLALLVPIIIALVAILLFIPTTLLSRGLRSRIEKESVQPSKQLDGLSNNVEEVAQAEAMEPYLKACAQDANALDAAILQTTQRELLDYRVFADPNQTSPLIFDPFRQAFLAGVDEMLRRLNAGSPPTDVEIQTALDSSPTRAGMGRRAGTSSTRASGMGGLLDQRMRMSMRMMSEVDRKIIAKICEDKARTSKVYVSPVDLGGYLYWSDWKFEDRDKAIKDSWYWQMAYWMLEDVVTTVQQMNRDAANVLQSPVKRIMSVQFTQSRASRNTIGARSRRSMAPKDKATPAYVVNAKNAMTGTPCTGRFTSSAADAAMDVMQFQVSAVVSSAQVMRFMQELCSAKTHKFRGWQGDQPEQTFKHNQITILESSMLPVDREDFDHTGYEYGPDEVVTLEMICEYLFFVPAYSKLQPAQVQDDVVQAAAPPQR
ncbi:MAG: hypothetical protein MUC88_15340 [Planctomycetes bacterium]|nr:hypothetical protein [Planctomycetota bacterium]